MVKHNEDSGQGASASPTDTCADCRHHVDAHDRRAEDGSCADCAPGDPCGAPVSRFSSDPLGSMCLGCEQGPDHRHSDAEDGPRLTCCQHICGVTPYPAWLPVWARKGTVA